MNEQYRLSVASSPHATSPTGTRNLMYDVIIALIPALVLSTWFLGPRVLTMTLVSVVGCVGFEALYQIMMKKPVTVGDGSAVITGILLVFVCPVTMPYWTILIGALFAIVIVKQLFGGLGANFLNPALAGRAFLMLCYPVAMTTWTKPGSEFWYSWMNMGILDPTKVPGFDAIATATPLSADLMKAGVAPDASLMDMFLGNIGGSAGEISAVALLLGGAYLLWRKVIRLRIPMAYILTVAVITVIFPRGDIGNLQWMLYEVLGGGIMLGAFFMATDYVTSPNTPKGELIYGIGCGLITVFIRYFGGYPEGVCYSILLMNVCVWLIDKYTMPARYGVTKQMKAEAKAKAKADKLAAKEAP